MFSRDGIFVEAKGANNAQMKIPEEGVSRNTRGRLIMEELGIVLEGRLIESAYDNGLFATYHEQGEAHRRRKTMTTENHSKGSDK